MEKVESVAEDLGKNEEKESKEATSAAGLLEKLSVGDESKSEEKTEDKAPTAQTTEEKKSDDDKKPE